MWSSFATPPDVLRDTGLVCLGAGEANGVAPGFVRRALPSHGLVLVTAGDGWYARPGERRPERVIAPAAIWLFPGVEHGYGSGPAGWHEHWILFSGAMTRVYRELGADSRRAVVGTRHGPDADTIGATFAGLREALSTPGLPAALRASALVQRLLLAAAAGLPERHPTHDVLGALEQTAAAPTPIAERAHRLGLAPAGLRERVREQTGMTPQEYILGVRLARAQSLLAETRLDIATVAARVGYDDPAYFSRLFAARVGVPPRAFRAQQSRDRETPIGRQPDSGSARDDDAAR
ncbi:helix-turn-helix domain-containing protein [Leifsonia poae]|uniref:helix-turn-helix domain-containing protein n=1 Tax=Leifsonia poae TaxID=110933 RepID=UPI001CBFF00B|nr:AraC family transcriptional regulator [Leifsonia poae]